LVAGIVYIWFFRKRNKLAKLKERKKIKIEKNASDKELSPYKDGKFILYCFICLLFSICFFQLFSTLPIFYKDVAKLDQQTIGYVLGYSGFIIVILEMFLVQVSEKYFSLAATMFWGTLLCGLSYATLILEPSLWIIFLSISLLSIGEIWAFPFMSTITAMRSGENNKGAYMGLNGISFSAAFIITPFVGTYVAKHFGFQTLWISTGLIMLAAATAFYFIVPWMLKKS
jgi:predicted MFS family arabinose efflux permease